MFIELNDKYIINTDNIGSVFITWEYSPVTKSTYKIHYMLIQGVKFKINESEYDKLKTILVHGVVDTKLSRWQKMKILARHWLKGLRWNKSSSED